MSGDKIFITAPTGSGNSYFVLNKLLPYAYSKKVNILYLVNRKILKAQLQEYVKEIAREKVKDVFLN